MSNSYPLPPNPRPAYLSRGVASLLQRAAWTLPDPGEYAGFALCDEATRRGLPVPPELAYRPAMGGPGEPEDFDAERAAELSDDDLAAALAPLHEFCEAATALGLDY